MKRSPVFRSYFFSYLLMISCSVCFAIALYFYAFQIAKSQSSKINQMLIDKLQVEVDEYVGDALKLQEDLIIDKTLRKVTALKDVAMSDQEVLLEMQRNIIGKHSISETIDNIFIYLKHFDTVLSAQGHMSSQLFYQLYYENEIYTHEEMRELLNQDWHWSVVPLLNAKGERELVFLQTSLSYGSGEDSATVAVTINESVFQQWLDETKWDDALEIFILGKDGLVVGADEQLLEAGCLKYGDSNRNSMILLRYKKYAVASSYSKNRDWEYILLMPDKLLKNDARKIQIFAIFGFFMCITVGMYVAYLLTKKHYRPLRLVMDQFEQQGEGRFEFSENEYQWLIGRMEKIHEERKNNKKQLKCHYLYQLLTRPWPDVPDKTRLFQAGLTLEGDYNLVIVVEFNLGDLQEVVERKEYELIRFSIMNVFEELAEETCRVESVVAGEDLVCLLNTSSIDGDFREWLEGIADGTQKRIREWFGVQVMFFAGSVERGLDCIYTSYLHANESAKYGDLIETESLIWYEAIENRRITYKYSLEEEQRIINALRVGDSAKVKELMRHVLEKNAESKNYLAYDLIGTLMRGADAGGLMWLPADLDIEKQLSGKYSNEMLEQKFFQLSDHICSQIISREEEQRNDCELSGRVMEYVKQNYQNPDLNISITAMEFRITPSYLSSLFKEQMGMGLLDYINQTRVEQAKELLKQGKSVAETAEKTGFSGSASFIRVFKRVTGITPGQMKKLQDE